MHHDFEVTLQQICDKMFLICIGFMGGSMEEYLEGVHLPILRLGIALHLSLCMSILSENNHARMSNV